MSPCDVHAHAVSSGVCRTCLGEFCQQCLVYSFGTSKPPHCMGCALEAAGATGHGSKETQKLIA